MNATRPSAYRLGLDMGSNSLGWAIIRLDEAGKPDYLVRLGVRIFSSGRKPKDGSSLAVDRRLARQKRRRRDRLLRRKARLLSVLRKHGLFPTEEEASQRLKGLNPYELRVRGLDAALAPTDFGRIVFHLNQRRGFRSSRRTDRGERDEKGKVHSAIAKLRDAVQSTGARTVGEYLYQRLREGRGTRARRFGEGTKATYAFYVDRSMTEHEFDTLWATQREYHPHVYSDVARDEIKNVLLFQRPLRPVNPGRCSLEPNEPRAPLALPSVQLFRILQEINNIRVREDVTLAERALTANERDAMLSVLARQSSCTFARLRSAAGISKHAKLNLESEKRTKLLGATVNSQLARDEAFGAAWRERILDEQDALVTRLLDDRLPDDAILHILRTDYALSHESSQAVLDADLPDGYARLSLRAIRNLLPFLEQGMTYDKAVASAGYAGTSTHGDGTLDSLPYYGQVLERHVAFGTGDHTHTDEQRYGKIANPSVHIALNELRKLTNGIIRKYGKPTEVAIELTRDLKLSWQQAREIEREQAKRQEDNERLREQLAELGQRPTTDNVIRLRLFEELRGTDGIAARCVYTGEPISLQRLFSSEIEVDHILPYSRTLDDSIANKVLCVVRANRHKGNLAPAEAFSGSPAGIQWAEILERAAKLPRNRIRRFDADAMERYKVEGGFIARQLNDTRYMSRLAHEYMSFICPPQNVWATAGRLTGLLRAKWGLNELLSAEDRKNRLDNRHHAIDAVVIACTDRRTVQTIAAAADVAEGSGRNKLLSDLPHPWGSFLPGLENALDRVVISYRPDHNPHGQLHNDTAYGARLGTDDDGSTAQRRNVRSYVPLVSLVGTKPDAAREHVVDRQHGYSIASILERCAGDKQKERAELEIYATNTGVRRVRWQEQLTVIPLRSRLDERPYKFVKGDGNYCYEIYKEPTGKWAGEVVSMFDANQRPYRDFMRSPKYRTTARCGAPLIMRLTTNDTVRFHLGDCARVYRVQKFSDGQIVLAHVFASGDPARNKVHIPGITTVMSVAPSKLRTMKARRVFVDILGRVFDPGVPDAGPNRRDSGR